jgi:protein-S-isoprenylcysteine O-methyltransferase Ste14
MPLDIPDAHTAVLKVLGVMIAFFGVYLVLWASAMLFRNRTALMTNRIAARLVIAGPFRYSRNPIYLGYTLLTIGYGIHIDNGWIPLAAIAAAVGTHLHVIRKEEMHLLARFGYEFERYCRRTRAWI